MELDMSFSGSGNSSSGPDCLPPSICSSTGAPSPSQTPTTLEESDSTVLIIAVAVSAAASLVLISIMVILIVALIFCRSKRSSSSNNKEGEVKRRSSRFSSGKSVNPPPQPSPNLNATLLLPKQVSRSKIIGFSTKGKKNQRLSAEELTTMQPKERLKILEFPHSKVCILAELGESSFGKFYRGECAKLLTADETTPVLIKTLREGSEPYLSESFEEEMKLASGWHHPNILPLLAVSTGESPHYMIYEWLEFGNLKDFLQSTASVWLQMEVESVCNVSQVDLDHPAAGSAAPQLVGTDEMVAIVVQIAEAMEYLGGQGFVHKDLTARNCQIGEGLIVKISNFGLSHDMTCMQYSEWTTTNGEKSFGPLRWTAPEILQNSAHSMQSDVWAYGILLWEVFSFGEDPYPDLLTGKKVMKYVLSSQIMPQPENCPKSVYKIMLSCWNPLPSRRPSFPWLKQSLKASIREFDLENVSRRFSYYKSPSVHKKGSEF